MLLAVFASTLILVAAAARAQTAAGSITYAGAAPYTDAELGKVGGLQVGQALGESSLANAAQRLIDTGLFDDVRATYTGQGKATAITFKIKPMPFEKLPAASLENFVWFTPDEMTDGIHARVPLYRGYVPEAGNTAESIQTALEQMLTAKGVKATLSHTIVGPTSKYPAGVMNFRVEQPELRVASVKLSIVAVSPEATAAAKVSMPRSGIAYNEGLAGTTIEDFLLSAARNSGYIDARMDDLHREIVNTANGAGVAVSAKVTPGDVYKVAAINWTATPVYSAADFKRDAKLASGDLAKNYQLRETLALIVAAYHAQGYLDAYIDPAPTLDANAHTVSYAIHAVPGEQYHLKSVSATGLDPAAQKDFDQGWTMKPGDVYNEAYVQKFITGNAALQNLGKYAGSYQISADPQTHLVDLTMMFSPNLHR